jgi:hypothetical protein
LGAIKSLKAMKFMFDSLPWKEKSSIRTSCMLILDDFVAEYFKWNNLAVDDEIVFSLNEEKQVLGTFLGSNKINVVILLSSLSIDAARLVRNILSAVSKEAEVFILTSVSEESADLISFNEDYSKRIDSTKCGYDGLEAFLRPSSVAVTYFPIHTLHLLHRQTSQAVHENIVDLGILSSYNSRCIQPFTLSDIRLAMVEGEEGLRDNYTR